MRFGPGKHGSTFGGNPLVCAVGLAVIDVIEREGILQHVVSIGDYLLKNLQEVFQHHSQIIDIRGQGLMIGVELASPAFDRVHLGLKHGVLFNIVANQVIRFLPPLIIQREEIDILIQRLQREIEV